MSRVSHARKIPYWELVFMKQALNACHLLFDKKQIMWDELYLLKVMSYGQLQKGYTSNEGMLQ